MKLFPATADLDPLMRAVVSAFEPHRPESRSEEARGDAFTDLCCNLARDGFEKVDTVAEKWLRDHIEHVMWLACAAIDGDSAEINRAKNSVADEFVSERADEYADDARVRIAELADAEAEQAANEATL